MEGGRTGKEKWEKRDEEKYMGKKYGERVTSYGR